MFYSKNMLFFTLGFSVLIKLLILSVLGVQTFPDGVWYMNTAEAIYNNSFIYPDNELRDAPGTPYFYAIFFPLVHYVGIKGLVIGNIIVATLSIFIFYHISLLIFDDIRAANLAALVSAMYPFFNFYSITVLTEIIYIFFLYVAFYYFIRFYRTKHIRYIAFFAIFFALDTLVRFANLPMFVFFILLSGFLMKRENINNGFIIKILTICSVCFVLVMSPWWVRNYQVHGKFVMTSVGESGKVFYSGNNPHNKSGGGIGGIDVHYEDLAKFEQIKDLAKRDEVMFKAGLDWIKKNPTDWIVLEFRKLIRLYSPIFYAKKYSTWYYNLLSIVSYGSIFILFLVSLYSLRKYFWLYSPMLLYLLLLTGVHLVFIASIRYRLPVEPFMIIMATKMLLDIGGEYFPNTFHSSK